MKIKKVMIPIFMLAACLAGGGCALPDTQSGKAAGSDAEIQTYTLVSEAPQKAAAEKNAQNDGEVMQVSSKAATREEISMEDLQTTTYTLDGVDFKMILVEAGTFTMGSDNGAVAFSESPAHKVTLTRDYLIGESEVTEALWNVVMGDGGGSVSMPKTSITWNQAHDFIDRLNEKAHEQGLIPEGRNFKLPTEAEWEFAAKGGNLSKGYLYSGSDNIDDVAQTLENTGSGSPVAVMQKSPNELGIYDMSGNAYEWVDDYAGSYSAEDQTNPQNTTPAHSYVKRGGSNYHAFSSEPYLFTTTGRYFYGSTDWTIGFRIALQ